ncbi:CPBP family intramembrane metalloprotease [Wenzhouxiangella sp. AB-CW3]|uniref:CPBP family intramembrane glutamic endopeptidase n=1 Tax=Wenzhouxiangella sp. AB-CW3 TaxID=2771012 RepID=UPI00168A5D36|nr:CPBP family intramembrane glutamic endopeptidase [Wenzhouxiangella sp. AB-CW3]QOC23992.1 CPBP family intramembrane metalloprotease [Wenzhouxiangella sp. AB-CW3]
MRHPLRAALIFQGGLVVLAVALCLLFGLTPWASMEWSLPALALAVTLTVPLLLPLLFMRHLNWAWAREIHAVVNQLIKLLFRRAPRGSVVLVAALAGIGEELLFRGFIQDGLDLLLGPIPALLIAAVLFGLVHAVTRAYFIIATLMGAYLGWIYLATGNLLVPILIHALYDWIAIRYYLFKLTTEPAYDAE